MIPTPVPYTDSKTILAEKQTAPYSSPSRPDAIPIEADGKTENLNSSSDSNVTTGTYTLVMRVPGKSNSIYWSLQLPKSFGIKASNLKENISQNKSDSVSKGSRKSRIINNQSSRLRMTNIRWADLAFNKNFTSQILEIEKEENIRVDLFLGAYNFSSSFSELLFSRIKRNCIRLELNKDGLIPLANDPQRTKFNPTTGLIKDYGSCAIRTDGKSSKFIRRTALGDYDLEVDCWSNVTPGICRARSSFKGWPIRIRLSGFTAQSSHRYSGHSKRISEFPY